MKRSAFSAVVLSVLMAACLLGCPTRPSASFAATPRVGPAPLDVQFTDQSTPGSSSIASWLWDFGDGGTSTLQNPSHTYAVPGAYAVSLTVSGSSGSDEESRKPYIVADADNEETLLLPGGVPLTMVWIPAGTFDMGAPVDELGVLSADRPVHTVTLSEGYWLGKYELTKAQWEAVMDTQPWSNAGNVLNSPDSPAVLISWYDTQTFIEQLNDVTGQTFRLPTEAEWEHACRAGTTERFYWGTDADLTLIDDYAWNTANADDAGEPYAHVVGQKLPNAWGLYDMSGNAWEWCQDWFGAYTSDPVTDPTGPGIGIDRVVRGGSWYNPEPGTTCRSAYRGGMAPGGLYTDYGFRLCRSAGD